LPYIIIYRYSDRKENFWYSVSSFRDSRNKIFCGSWFADRVKDKIPETELTIDMAASIILNEILLRVYGSNG
jgi:hypothetical protein